MSDLFKKIFTVGVVFTTILWAVGVAALPLAAQAATCPTLAPGDMVKVTGRPAIYVVNNNLKTQYFPSGDVFKSWRPTYGGYISITMECLDYLGTPSVAPYGVNYHAGSYVVKRVSSDQLYVVKPGNMLQKITSVAAAGLYGSDLPTMPIEDMFWPNYVNSATVGTEAEINAVVPHEGMLVKVDSKTYYVDAGSVLREVTATGMTANGLQTRFVNTLAASTVSGFTTGATIDAAIATMTDKTQSGGVATPAPVTGGALTVSLAVDTPASRNVADGTVYNDALKLNLAASNNAVKVTGLTITKTGLLANAQVTGVSVWDKMGVRHGDVMTSLTSDNKVTVGFASNPILVAAGTTETLLVKVNLGTNAQSSVVGFKIGASTDVATDGTVGGTFPITGNDISILDGAGALATLTVASSSVGGINDTGANAPVASTGNMEVGDLQKEIGKFRLAETGGLNDVSVQSLTFYLEGSIQDSHLNNFKVYAQDGTLLGTTMNAKDRYVTVSFTNGYTIPKSTNRDVSLKADVVDGSGYYVRAHIQNDYDIIAKDVSAGYYIAPVQSNGGTFLNTFTINDWFKIKSGTMTLNKTATSPSGNVSAGSNNTLLASFDVKAVGEGMEVRKMGLTVTKVGGDKLTGNVVVRDATTHDTYLTVAASDANLYTGYQYNLSAYINLTSGQTKTLEVLGSILSTATNTEKYTVGIGNFYAKRLSTLDFADALGNASNNGVLGNQMTVNTTNLSLSKDTALGNVNRSKGTTRQIVGQYVIQAGSAEDIRLTGVSVKFTGINNTVALTYQNLELWNGTTQLGSTISSVATSSNSFNFTLNVGKNLTQVLVLKADVLATANNNDTVISNVDSYNYTGLSSGNSNTNDNDVVGQQITIKAAQALLTAVSDASTQSKVYGPTGTSEVQLGKWKLEAKNQQVTLGKITLVARDQTGATDAASGNFGTLSLYDGTTKLGEGTYVAGTVLFTGLNCVVPADGYKTLTLKGRINDSGALSSQTMDLFIIKSDDNSDLELTAESGGLLAFGDINAAGAESYFASSSLYRFEDAYPTIASVSMGTSLTLGDNSPIFKFTVTNSGTRDMRFASTTVTVTPSGLAAGGSVGGNYKLWQATEAGGLGTLLADNATTTAGNYASNVFFNESNDGTNNLLANFVIPAGQSVTFIVTANTNQVLTGKTQGTVSVSAKIGGSTGYNGAVWSAGGMFVYTYTPVGGVEAPLTNASDSYEVVGTTMEKSI